MRFILFILLLTSFVRAEIPLPSSSPIDVFDYDKDTRGIGYYRFNVQNYQYDEGYDTPIPMGEVESEAQGFMYLWPKFDSYQLFGIEVKHFESAISVGLIDSKIIKKANPSNYYDKEGFFVGYHPAFSAPLYKTKKLHLSLGASLPLIFYSMHGYWRVVQGYIDDGIYEDETYGVAFKPTLTAQGSVYVLNNFALSAYVGFTQFSSAGINFYSGGKWGEDDSELESDFVEPKYIMGYDISYRAILDVDDSISLSSAFQQADNSESENLVEYRLLYKFKF